MTLKELLEIPAWQTEDYKELEEGYWSHIRNTHFDSEEGSQFWLDRASQFRVNPIKDGMTLQEFLKHEISDYEEGVLKAHPSEYFIPKGLERSDIEAHTSSGSVGSKKETYWSKDALTYAAHYGDYIFDEYGIPRNIEWLVTGTLLFYELVKKIVERRGGMIHTDLIQTREFKRFLDEAREMPPEEFVKTPSYEHRMKPVMEFYSDTLNRENIGGMVSALFMLPAVSHEEGFKNVRAIYLSGMEIPLEQLQYWRKRLPDKIFLTSYGHHQLGMGFALPDFEVPMYYPPAPVSLTYVVKPDNPFKLTEYGERGRVRLIRMDEALLWVQTERDYAERMEPHKAIKWDGIRDVKPSWV